MWILDIIRRNGGGWFHPFRIHMTHPLLDPLTWDCLHCGQTFLEDEYAVVMPFHGLNDDRWVASHRECIMEQLGFGDGNESGSEEGQREGPDGIGPEAA